VGLNQYWAINDQDEKGPNQKIYKCKNHTVLKLLINEFMVLFILIKELDL